MKKLEKSYVDKLKKVLDEILLKELGEVPSEEFLILYGKIMKNHYKEIGDLDIKSLWISFKRDGVIDKILKK